MHRGPSGERNSHISALLVSLRGLLLLTQQCNCGLTEVKTPTPHKPHLCSSTSNFCHRNFIFFKSRFWHLQLILQLSSLCFCVSRTYMLGFCWCRVLSPCVLRRQYSEEEVVACPHHFPTVHTSHTPWFCGYRRQTHLSQVMSPSSRTNSMDRRN